MLPVSLFLASDVLNCSLPLASYSRVRHFSAWMSMLTLSVVSVHLIYVSVISNLMSTQFYIILWPFCHLYIMLSEASVGTKYSKRVPFWAQLLEHASPVVHQLQWLPIGFQAQLRVLVITFITRTSYLLSIVPHFSFVLQIACSISLPGMPIWKQLIMGLEYPLKISESHIK